MRKRPGDIKVKLTLAELQVLAEVFKRLATEEEAGLTNEDDIMNETVRLVVMAKLSKQVEKKLLDMPDKATLKIPTEHAGILWIDCRNRSISNAYGRTVMQDLLMKIHKETA